MGRPSKLTEPMKADVLRMLAEGKGLREVSRDTGIAYTTLRRNFSDQVPKVKDVGMALARAELDLAKLPVSAQRAARTLADRLKDIQEGYATVTERSTKTSIKLANLAGRLADQIPDEGEVDTQHLEDALAASKIQKAANVALLPASNLIAANKGQDQKQAKSLEDILEEANRIHEGRTA